jgi:hypothetical protein
MLTRCAAVAVSTPAILAFRPTIGAARRRHPSMAQLSPSYSRFQTSIRQRDHHAEAEQRDFDCGHPSSPLAAAAKFPVLSTRGEVGPAKSDTIGDFRNYLFNGNKQSE